MAKIPRTTQVIFAGNAPSNEIEEFGSTAQGHSATTNNVASIMSGTYSEWDNGWLEAIVGADNPYLESFNAVEYAITSQLAYLFQEGVPEWDAGTSYYAGSVVSITASSGNVLFVYVALQTSTPSQAPTGSATSNSYWGFLYSYNVATGLTLPINTNVVNANNLPSISNSGYSLFGSASIVTGGGPVALTASGQIGTSGVSGGVSIDVLALRQDQAHSLPGAVSNVNLTAQSGNVETPFALTAIDTPAAGSYTYQLYYFISGGSFSTASYSINLIEVRR